ncbi:MAG: sigma-70 family RNA polymerase sigma factor [Bradyrhizobiaceae bacterium]|nr:sigma-70 family RNA polymerase sigma factor [Bradyrhizobiaceae bacterium]
MEEQEVRLRDFIDAVSEGDRAALEHLYKITGAKLYGVVLRILRKPALAELALPEAYLRIWRDAVNYDPAVLDAHSWIVMHARRAALDLARERASLVHADPQEAPEQPAEPDEAEAGHEVSDQLKQLLACMATLSPDPRLMLLLAYYDGWSRRELAIEFDAPPATIRTWMLRGLEQIRECTEQ